MFKLTPNFKKLAIVFALSQIITSQSVWAAETMHAKLIVAHRGAPAYLPEHSLPSKVLAYGMGADYLEQDIVLTKDNVPVILHDHYLDTVTNVAQVFKTRAREDGRYYAIDFTLAEIKSLNLTERFNRETGEAIYAGRFPLWQSTFKVPTLVEEIELIQGLNKSTGKNVGIYPEIKAPAFHRAEGKDISKIVIEILAEYGYDDKTDAVYLQCFDWNETQRIRNELGYKGKLVQLLAENSWGESPDVDFDYLKTAQGLADIAKIADGIGPWMTQIVPEFDANNQPIITDLVKNAHENGLQIHPYTFRQDSLPKWAKTQEETMQLFLYDIGVDGLFTDFTDVAVKFVENHQ
ncbi:MAG: glycerophosphodiester phosphodiesterase [Hyphomicrobiales bacterium]|nr:MAG: glycerophosphodiester phosphodiesterase [Hyphomicrobiales bacterium]